MLAEVMSALADELSYVQDRYAREAYLETATRRRSLRRHARLVDYNIHDGRSAGTSLDLTVESGGTFVDAGKRVWAPSQGERPIPFELGNGLADTTAGPTGGPRQFWVHAAWNEIPAYLPDESAPCLPVGATELFMAGTFPTAAQLPAGEDPARFWIGKWLLIRTDPQDPSVPARRHLVRVVEVEHTIDPLTLDAGNNPIEITRIRWENDQALPFEMCLHDMVVRGNLVFATAGETFTDWFVIRTNDNLPEASPVVEAVERQGLLDDVAGRRSTAFLHSLAQTEAHGLGWLGSLRNAQPEVELQEVDATSLAPLVPPQFWEWQRSLLDSRSFQDHFALEDGTWRRIIGFQRIGEVIEHVDYASGSGFTVRFGDGEFGRIPGDGTVFQVRYRTGPGTRANLPADTIVNLVNPADDSEADLAGVLAAVTNPLAIGNGLDTEARDVIRQLAPEAFRAVTFRAVRPEDYAEIAQRLPFVQRAGARFRWTGSWLSAFVTVDPLGSFQLSREQKRQLADLMDAVRQAGREVFVRNPRFVNLDLEITICVEPSAYAGQVKARVLEALLGRKGVRPARGFFDPDNFTFGTPLRRAVLEAAIQDVPGVRGVEEMRIRARGITSWRRFDELTFAVRHDQILRLQNDPRFPERGSLRIVTREEAQQA
jgi:Baseplate J-like protein